MNGLGLLDLLMLFGHFLVLSLLSIGGAMATAPEMHRITVLEHHWLSDEQFTTSVALAQAAPGPNLLFVAVIGWNVAGVAGVVATMTGILIPSTTLALAASRWARERRDSVAVRAFSNGMAPLTVGLLVATGWVLSEPYWRGGGRGALVALGLIAVSVAVMLRTRASPMWLIALGAAVGAAGWV